MVAAAVPAAADFRNVALVFVKPHAATPQTIELVSQTLQEKGAEVLRQGSVDAAKIEAEGIIDAHYATIAKIGMARDLSSLGLGKAEAEKFLKGYGRSLDEAMAAGELCSAVTAMEVLSVSPSELLSRCLAAGYEKLRSGLYCAKLAGNEDGTGPRVLYVVNGFYARMREKYVVPGVIVHWFVIRFDGSQLPWRDFRAHVIGATQPVDAADGSLRALIRDRWQSLGLKEETNYQDNGLHASAGPLEALRERMVWLGDDPEADPLGSALLSRGLDIGTVRALAENPSVELGDGRQGAVFDLLEDVDTNDALAVLTTAKVLKA